MCILQREFAITSPSQYLLAVITIEIFGQIVQPYFMLQLFTALGFEGDGNIDLKCNAPIIKDYPTAGNAENQGVYRTKNWQLV